MLKLLLAATIVVASPAIPQTTPMTPGKLIKELPADEPTQPDVVFQNYPLVKRIDCAQGRGSGFRIGQRHMLSVAHVTALSECGIGGFPISVTEQDGEHDFARLNSGESAPNGIAIDCRGFQPGHWYWAVGFAKGADFQTAVAIYATVFRGPDGKRILIGQHTVIPGMSGGPVLDPATGAAVGTVNAYVPGDGLSLSRELKDTSVCGVDNA
jgi:hypothetical protein